MLHIHFGNRIEKLADALAELMRRQPPGAKLAPETIVVGHAGMDEWLKGALAGRLGVAANIDFYQPAGFVWRMLRAHDRLRESGGDLPAKSPLDRGPLAWRLYSALAQDDEPAEIERYMGGGDELKRFELAGEIAKVFEQYQMYRPGWLRDWLDHGEIAIGGKRGKWTAAQNETAAWQCTLWRAVAGGQTPNPARLYEAFNRDPQALAKAELPLRISVFGIAAMAPVYLQLFVTASLSREVHLFVPNPSQAYWGDTESAKRLARWELTRPGRSEYVSTGHPLLSALGTQSRDFVELLVRLPDDRKVTHDHFGAPQGEGLLARLQTDVLELVEEPEKRAVVEADDSIRMHACHSRRREVEVLHDRLLAAFEADPRLGPEDILVMAPNIDDYADHVAAVFGAAPAGRYIPWSLAERSARAEHPLVEAFLSLLDLPETRLKASEVLGLLDLPAVARRYGLDADDLDAVHRWTRGAGIRWARDGAHRERLGVPAESAFTWQFGLDRLLAGYAMAPGGDELWQGIAPWPGIEGRTARALGPLCRLVQTLDRRRVEFEAERPLADWVAALQGLLEVFEPRTRDELSALHLIRDAIEELGGQAELARFDAPVSHRMVRAALAGRLAMPRHPRPFLSGQVTFCALAPLRSIPAKFVWLLGMSEADFPRRGRAPGFDLIAAHPERGDRARRTEDRALFLDALLSARRYFHVSYVGKSERDNEDLPASVVVNLLVNTLEAMGANPESIVVTHPLQPFSSSLDPADRRKASYAEEWLGRPAEALAPQAFAPPASPGAKEALQPQTIELDGLIEGLVNPARRYLEALDVGRLSRHESDEDDEPFVLDGLGGWTVRDTLLARRLEAGTDDDMAGLYEQLAARGALPPGEVGRLEFEHCRIETRSLAREVQACLHGVAAEPREIDLDLGVCRLVGKVESIYPGVELLEARAGKLRVKDRLTLWIEYLALLCADAQAGVAATTLTARFLALEKGKLETCSLQPPSGAAGLLAGLCELYLRSERGPIEFLPQLSRDIRKPGGRGKNKKIPGRHAALEIARSKWRGWENGDRHAFIHDAEDYALVMRDREEVIDERFVTLAMHVFDPLIRAEAGK